MSQETIDHIADLIGVPHKHVSEFGYINDGPLMAENEPARHKLMDVLGDLALIGRPLKGKVIATRPGHTINTTFASRYAVSSSVRMCRLLSHNPTKEPLMDVNQIRALLPHRFPFLLVDKIIEKGSQYIVGLKNVNRQRTILPGAFPAGTRHAWCPSC